MALHYDLGPLYKKYKEDPQVVNEHLAAFCKKSKKTLKHLKQGIEDKKYLEVERMLMEMKPDLEFLGMDAALEGAYSILAWTAKEGRTKEVKEIYKVFRVHVKNAVKELQHDFDFVI